MVHPLILLLLTALLGAATEADLSPLSADVYLLGVSHHTHGEFREVNPGLGFGISSQANDHLDVVAVGVTYKDSYNQRAVAVMAGARLVAGDRRGLHVSAAAMVGTLQGSGWNGPAVIPVFAAGYGFASLEAAPLDVDAIGAWLRVSIPLRD
jgi:hypothetical protein